MKSAPTNKKTLLIISFSDLARDPRVNRQIRFLHERYHIIAAGTADPGIPGVQFIQLRPTKKAPSPQAQPGTRKGAGQLRYAVRRLQRLAPGNGQLADDLSTIAPSSGGVARAMEDMADTAARWGFGAYRILRGGVRRMRKAASPLKRAEIHLRLLIGQYERHYWKNYRTAYLINALSHVQTDLVLANDIEPLPFALRLARQQGARIIFDAHEYFPRMYEDIPEQRIFYQNYRRYMCQHYIPQVDAMITVGEYIADQYERDTGVRPLVITNAADYVDLTPMLRSETERRIRMIHHGRGNRSRKIDQMITIMDNLDDRFELDMLLVASNPDDTAYIEGLKQRVENNPRVRILEPIPARELIHFSNHYDIGLYLLSPTGFNTTYALPNKFFEFIQSRLALAIGPSPEMARLITAYDCGIVSDDFSPRSLAERLKHLDHARINYYKQQAHKAASKLNAETNRTLLLDLVQRVLE